LPEAKAEPAAERRKSARQNRTRIFFVDVMPFHPFSDYEISRCSMAVFRILNEERIKL
jgi:hypothetical protein